MNWNETPDRNLVLVMRGSQAFAPILAAGTKGTTLWCWTGDETHLRRFKNSELEPSADGKQAIIRQRGEIVAFVEPEQDHPLITDPLTYHQAKAEVKGKMETESFKGWLADEVELTS